MGYEVPALEPGVSKKVLVSAFINLSLKKTSMVLDSTG